MKDCTVCVDFVECCGTVAGTLYCRSREFGFESGAAMSTLEIVCSLNIASVHSAVLMSTWLQTVVNIVYE